jgi:hypothetical protein
LVPGDRAERVRRLVEALTGVGARTSIPS